MIAATVRDILTIRRIEFLPVEATIFLIPVLARARDGAELTSPTLIEGAVVFFVLFSLGDIINCLNDRHLDALYKRRLSDAVSRLGVPLVRTLVVLCAVLALALGAHLAFSADNLWLLALVALGLFLGVQYSTGPLHLKSQGLAHLACLWLLLYVLPMLYAAMLVGRPLDAAVVALAASYATAEMGIILVNTSEDFPEDVACGVRTTTVALGLRPTMAIATVMVAGGGLAFVIQWVFLLGDRGWPPMAVPAVATLGAALAFVLAGMARLVGRVRAAPTDAAAVAHIKAHGTLVPVWAMTVGAGGLACALAYFNG